MVKVKTTGIYARIVGYYRPVEAWNAGKRQELKDRQIISASSLTAPK